MRELSMTVVGVVDEHTVFTIEVVSAFMNGELDIRDKVANVQSVLGVWWAPKCALESSSPIGVSPGEFRARYRSKRWRASGWCSTNRSAGDDHMRTCSTAIAPIKVGSFLEVKVPRQQRFLCEFSCVDF
jgi:hypothetical protein